MQISKGAGLRRNYNKLILLIFVFVPKSFQNIFPFFITYAPYFILNLVLELLKFF